MDKQKGRGGFIAMCVLPAVLLFFVFMILPHLQHLSHVPVQMGRLFVQPHVRGFENFTKLFRDMKFLQSVENTLLLIVVVSVITMSLAIIFAAILSREKIKGQNFFRVVFYIPNILSIVIISAIFSAIYDANNGMLNSILALFKGADAEPVYWLGDQSIVIYSLAGAMIWQAIGYYMVMYMASMASFRSRSTSRPTWRAPAASISSSTSLCR